jgi:hypothetical protein
MNPSSPVRLTTWAVDISMQATDHFFFEFDVDGVFESPHAKEFHPHLPHDSSFKAGSVWPDREKHPLGVHPLKNGQFNYTWTPDNAVKPKDSPTENTGTIHVTSGI